MRWTGVPQSGQGFPYRPCTAMPSRNAVTFSGNARSASRRNRSIHSPSTPRTAACSRAISSSDSRLVSFAGESFARWRISSE
jgi:hypothetical protein